MHQFPFVQFYLRAALAASSSPSPELVADQEGLELTNTSPAIASDSAAAAARTSPAAVSSPAGIPSPPTPPTPAVRHRRRSHESIVVESYSPLNDPSDPSVVIAGAAALLTRSDDSTLEAMVAYEGSWLQSPALRDLWLAFRQVGLNRLDFLQLVVLAHLCRPSMSSVYCLSFIDFCSVTDLSTSISRDCQFLPGGCILSRPSQCR